MRTIENLLEGLIYASRWLLAPIYMILCLCLALIAITTIQHFIQYAPGLMSMKLKEVLLFVLQVVDLALIANLVVMIIFSGYENFISKIDVAKGDRDRPDWMGSVDFSDLKIKLERYKLESVTQVTRNTIELAQKTKELAEKEIATAQCDKNTYDLEIKELKAKKSQVERGLDNLTDV